MATHVLPTTDSESVLSRSFQRPSRRHSPAILSLDSVLFDLWPALTDPDYHSPGTDPQPFGPVHLQHPHLPLTFQDPAKLPESSLPAPDCLFDDTVPHVFRPTPPSPLHSPLSSPGLNASPFPSSPYQHSGDTPPFSVQQGVDQSGYFNMVKNRRSLQSILIPPFLQSNSSSDTSPSPTQSTRVRSLSAAASTSPVATSPAIPLTIPSSPAPSTPVSPPGSSPPSDLLDDDPFADLTAGPSVISLVASRSRPSSLSRTGSVHDAPPRRTITPRSPLSQHSFGESDDITYPSFDASSSAETLSSTPTTPPPTPVLRSKSVGTLRRPWSSGHGQARPAYTRPAFQPRPSLPSLHALASAQVMIPKVRRGRVGAQLPYEPWQFQSSESDTSRDGDIDDGVDLVPGLNFDPAVRRKPSTSRRPSGLTTIRDSRIITGALVSSPAELDGSERQPEYVDGDDVNCEGPASIPTAAAEASASPHTYEHQPLPVRATGPGLTRAHSEPYPSLRTLSGLHLDPHARVSLPTDADRSLPYNFPSPPSHTRRNPSLEDASYSTIFPSHTRSFDLPSSLDHDDCSFHDDLSLLDLDIMMSPHAALEAIGYSAAGVSTEGKTDAEEFEPGTSAETIRTLSASHRRTSSNYSQQSQTLEWESGSVLLSDLPVSPASTSSGSDQSSSEEHHDSRLAYDLDSTSDHGHLQDDFLTFHSDSSEESLSPTLMSMSMSTGSTTSTSTAHTPSSSTGPTPYNSIYEDLDAPFELDEDVICLSAAMPHLKRLSTSSSYSSSEPGESKYVTAVEELVDAGEGSGAGGWRGEFGGAHGAGGSDSRWNGNGTSGSSRGNGGFGHSNGGGHGGGRDDGDRWNRRPPVRTALPIRQDSETSESEDEYGHEDDTMTSGAPVKSRTARRPSRNENRSETDDDVPLAQQIPTALKAQKTIRRQVRDEIDMRRKKKAESKSTTPVTLTPASASGSPLGARLRGSFNQDASALSSTREALKASAPPEKPLTRPRTKTLPSNSTNPFAAGDLKAKLLHIQSFSKHLRNPSDEGSTQAPARVSPVAEPSPTEASRTLRPQRSFHRPRTAESEHRPPPMPTSLDTSVKLGRSVTSASRRPPRHESPQYAPPAYHSFDVREDKRSSLERARTTRTAASSRRPSIEDEHEPSPRRPPMPPLPSAEVVSTFSNSAPAPPQKQLWHQRVFICSLQRYHQIEVDASTTAGDVLRILEKQDQLHGGPSLGPAAGWMLWEICHDFGMERPIRSFEILTDVSGSWVADKSTNAFLAKKTTLAPLLSRTAIPSSSPIFSGYVQHEYKRGKWQKRWMELREHSLWMSKKDNGKDQICVCSLQNFDAYVVSRVQKAPKAYVFAIKSTDNLSFFENTSDYMHLFSCSEKEGASWLEKILLARSYVLHQERNVLTNTSAPAAASGNTGAALSRAGTRKRPAQPLVNIGHVATPEVPIAPAVFEPGSLLAKRA